MESWRTSKRQRTILRCSNVRENGEEQEDDEDEEDGDELSDQEGFDNALDAGEISLIFCIKVAFDKSKKK